jgi:hypothetical protein
VRGQGFGRSVAGIAGALALLLVVAAVAGSPDAVTERTDPAHLGPRLVLVSVILTIVVGLVLFAFTGRRPWLMGLALVAGLLLAGVVVAILEDTPEGSVERRVSAVPQPDDERPEPSPTTEPDDLRSSGGDGPGWGVALGRLVELLAVAIGVLLVLALVVAAVATIQRGGWRRRDELAADPGASLEDEADGPRAARADLAAAIDAAIGELALDDDPRRVVVAAYVQMRSVLAEHGIEARPSDTPLELLARTLEQLHTSRDASRQLTALLEEAMFSTHPIDRAMADDALAALERVRDELRSAAWG